MGLFDAILKDEAYENSATLLQADTLAAASKSDTPGIGGGGGGGGGSGTGDSTGGGGGGGGSGNGSGGSGNGVGGVGIPGGVGNGNNIIIMDSVPLETPSTPSTATIPVSTVVGDPILNLSEEPIELVGDPVLGSISSSEIPTQATAEVPTLPEVNPVNSMSTDMSTEMPTITLDPPADAVVAIESPVESSPLGTPMVDNILEEKKTFVTEEVKVFETSPVGILEESIEKLKRLEEEARLALEAKNKEDEEYKARINELKLRDKTALQEAAKIEGEIEHIEEMIGTFSKELDKEKGVVTPDETAKK